MAIQYKNSKTKNAIDVVSYISIILEIIFMLTSAQTHMAGIKLPLVSILMIINVIPCAFSFVWIFVRSLGVAFRLYPSLEKKANDANIIGRYGLVGVLLIWPVEWILMYVTKIEPHIISASAAAFVIIIILLSYPILRFIEWQRLKL